MGQVTRCICHNCSFSELKAYAAEHNIDDVKQLQELKMCSCGCQMCKPYVELMLETGETEFEPGAPHRRKKSQKGN